MEFKKESTSRIAIFVLCLLFLFLFLCNSSSSSEQLFKGLRLCAETLIPSLFPYMVISEMLVRSGAVSFIAPAVGRVTKKLFRVSGAGGAALILGIICGFPVGAKTVAELYSQNMIEKDEAEKLMGICNLPSPPFIIFAVGDKLFGSLGIGLFLYFNVLTVTLLQGMMKKKSSAIGADHIAYNKAQPVFSQFTESVASAAGAVIKVCAFVAFFSAVIGGLTPFFDNTSPILKASIFSFFELASGTAACSTVRKKALGLVIASAAAGWSGLSVFCQIFSLSRTERGNISMRFYLTTKIISGAACAAVSAVILKLFPGLIPASPPASDTVSVISLYPSAFISAINIIFIISLFIYLSKKLDRSSKF